MSAGEQHIVWFMLIGIIDLIGKGTLPPEVHYEQSVSPIR